MSIKQYLFALFGGLILLLGLSQLLIGEALKRQLDEDLKANSVALSRQLVDILVDDLGENLRIAPLPADAVTWTEPIAPPEAVDSLQPVDSMQSVDSVQSVDSTEKGAVIERTQPLQLAERVVQIPEQRPQVPPHAPQTHARHEQAAHKQAAQAAARADEQARSAAASAAARMASERAMSEKALSERAVTDLRAHLNPELEALRGRGVPDDIRADDEAARASQAELEAMALQIPTKTEIIELQQREIGRAIADLDATLAEHQREAMQSSEMNEEVMAANDIIKRELEKLHRLQASLTRSYQEALHESLQTMTITRREGNNNSDLLVIRTLEDGRIERNQLEFKQDNLSGALTRFREWMALLILSSSLLALVFVYWLSRRVSEPLSELATGHRKLGAGELGYQVHPRGIEEIRSMLDGFNAMSQKLAELSAREQQVADKKHLAELGEITRGIAHSLRNPLHTLGLLAESQSQLDDEHSRSEMLGAIQQKIAMMDKSIQSLLTLASSEVDRSRPVPVSAVVRDILLELSVAGVTPSLSLTGLDDDHAITGIESEVRSILHAVIINAMEAQSGAAVPWLGIELNRNDDGLCVQVSDKGPGIDAALLDKLGQPHITTKAEGTGMGLYIASRLLASHYHGKLVFINRPEGGTRVKVLFGMNNTAEPRP
ncbi:HAMP domain-containing histidine kinase [Shewanella sp. JM162201]|uniref:histidine kinase n=1 Tax=Shewanella jiangmenensis TaxID=2837387 RepID=A0ABS5V5I9_9GAMM|nr:HAMP domain-containing sensor histidine kinase [Shewanella jiangmenensis]MBT1445710.1 HAMP domain-containing histidine kinase [Shewanella jiangmenensis]